MFLFYLRIIIHICPPLVSLRYLTLISIRLLQGVIVVMCRLFYLASSRDILGGGIT